MFSWEQSDVNGDTIGQWQTARNEGEGEGGGGRGEVTDRRWNRRVPCLSCATTACVASKPVMYRRCVIAQLKIVPLVTTITERCFLCVHTLQKTACANV